MKKIFEVGSIVLYKLSEDSICQNLGMVLKKKENNTYVILSDSNKVQKDIKEEWVVPIEKVEEVRQEINAYYDKEIEKLKNQLKVVTQEEKDNEKKEKYETLKEQIMATAKHMLESDNNDTFERKLKAIADLKKALFSIELACGSDIRKYNGTVKYHITTLEMKRSHTLKVIDDENIKRAFQF